VIDSLSLHSSWEATCWLGFMDSCRLQSHFATRSCHVVIYCKLSGTRSLHCTLVASLFFAVCYYSHSRHSALMRDVSRRVCPRVNRITSLQTSQQVTLPAKRSTNQYHDRRSSECEAEYQCQCLFHPRIKRTCIFLWLN
jgi:hypothetical protein